MRPTTLFLVCAAAGVMFSACAGEDPVGSTTGRPYYADQGYYPIEAGSTWRYRLDSTGANGITVRGTGERLNTMRTSVVLDSLVWAVQVMETQTATGTSTDTLYVRKSEAGVYLSSPTLRGFSLLPGLPGGGGFPKELLILPYSVLPGLSWELLNFEFTGIPLVQIYFRVKATYVGVENVTTEAGLFVNCARIRIDIDARFPNPQNPTDILNPIVIRDNASFWLSKPFGVIVGDGAESVFQLMRGRIPFGATARKIHQELLTQSIVQPPDSCHGRR